jgi:hypothetical protein
VFQNPLEKSMLKKAETRAVVPSVVDPFENWLQEKPEPNKLKALMESMDTFVGRLETAEKKLNNLEHAWSSMTNRRQ